MAPEIGQFALILALILALIQSVFPFLGAHYAKKPWMWLAKATAQGQFFLIGLAFSCLAFSFLTNDFTVLNVTSHSHSTLPVAYRFAATWGSHEGSLLLWVFLLSGWSFAVARYSQHLPDALLARILGVMGCISMGFLLFLLFTSNPFERVIPGALEGADLNPLLQDPAMVTHPPMLYMGYVGFSVAFAFVVSALLGGQLDAAWARWARPWTLLAWMFLTGGIMLGSFWAYYELGWGGWWFWDPVENASFVPWLTGTALIHSFMVTEKRNAFKSWTVLLAIATFSLSLLGTFLVRSGVLTSVHAFATDPARGIFVLLFLSCVTGGSLLLFALKNSAMKVSHEPFVLASRETFLLFNNVFLGVAAISVLLGTLYPLFLEVLGLGKISVGPPYFDVMFVPLMVPVVFLMGIGPLVYWKQMQLMSLIFRLRFVMLVSVLVGLLLPFWMGHWTPLISLEVWLATWALLTTLLKTWDRIKNHVPFTFAFAGMQLAHLGIVVFILGVTVSKGYGTQHELRIKIGEPVSIGAYQFKLNGITERRGPNYLAVQGNVTWSKNKEGGLLYPEKRFYQVTNTWLTEVAIHSTPLRHLYVALGDRLDETYWSIRVQYKPLVNWIWGGGAFMFLGGLLAAFDRRYRKKVERA